jgi:hypothetical protein
MIQTDYLDKLKESLQICEIHFQRMSYAAQKVNARFPLDENKYRELSPDDLSYLDQLIFRFSKMQDSMGNRLFRSVLENLGEDIEGKPFIDLLTKLEQLSLLEDHKQWLLLRETRNLVTHEYPFFTPEIIEGLNLLIEQVVILGQIWNRINSFLKERFKL